MLALDAAGTRQFNMKEKLNRYLENVSWVLLQLAPAVAAVLALLSLFGVFDRIPRLKTEIPALTLFVTAVLLELGITLRKKLGHLQYILREIGHERLGRVELTLNEIRVDKLAGIESALRAIRSDLNRDVTAKVSELKTHLDPRLRKVIGPYVDEHLDKVIDVFKKQTFELSDVERFRSFYRKTMEAYSPTEFHATSLPSAKFFWKDTKTEEAIRAFIHSGGVMKRIFFLADPDQLEETEVRQILARQKEIGVDVYTVVMEDVRKEWRNQYFVVDIHARIAWKLTITPAGTIDCATLSWEPEVNKRYLDLFEELKNLDAVKPYGGDALPSAAVAPGGVSR